MNWFYDLKIRVKLISCFTLVAVIAAIIGAVAAVNMKQLDANTVQYESAIRLMIVVTIIGFTLAIGTGIFLSAIITRPLHDVGNVLSKMMEGDFSARIAADYQGDFGVLKKVTSQ